MLHRSDAPQLLQGGAAEFDGLTLNFDHVGTLLQNPSDKQLVLEEFCMAHFRYFGIESFERVKVYAKATSQFLKLKKWENFLFFNAIRNTLAHDFLFSVRKEDQSKLPFQWQGITIDNGMLGKPMPVSFLRYGGFYQMHQELRQFAIRELK
ncbi:MAG: hypothetical protein CFE36_11290 [Sphingomonadaceae bacterium PASS1]|nr:MAG: hypothetical protein CFE36_11290 [Sphingomonadaceae bacterium PASS1]